MDNLLVAQTCSPDGTVNLLVACAIPSIIYHSRPAPDHRPGRKVVVLKEGEQVEHRLRSVVESNRSRLLPAVDAHRVWGERYFPIRPSILPPGFPGLSREFSSLAELPRKLERAENSVTSVALQGTLGRSGEILLLTLDAREMA